ncbi:MAG: hypothetical protein BWY92_01445 [Firmicutes bacterium ADurb.BinA052]|nr:MAG: hypothetical protein BWY92_01445 [Firmicutes bacterium ADurb.BinA052]
MVLEESRRLAEVITQVGDTEDVAGLLFDLVGFVLPEQVEDLAHAADDVVPVRPVAVETGVVHQDAVPGNTERILGIRDGRILDRALGRQGVCVRPGAEPFLADDAVLFRGQAVRTDQHSGRADRQRIKGVRKLRGECRVKGDADVPAAESDADATACD